MKKVLFLFVIALALALFTMPVMAAKPDDKGFDEAGYNRTARIFNGTGWDWCMEKVQDETWCESYLGTYAGDKIIMKWNNAWDTCNEVGTTEACIGAWLDNEWNGMMPGGSGETWHYKYVWVGPCGNYGQPVESGGYCIWGQYAVILSQGTAGGEHLWDTLAKPAGYGTFK